MEFDKNKTQELSSSNINQEQNSPPQEVGYIEDLSPDGLALKEWADNIEQSEQKKVNKTGIPDSLLRKFEEMSGFDLSEVRVYYNSDKPQQVGLDVLAYAEGLNIYISPGNEEHLEHELWHVVQQLEGRTKPTTTHNGEKIDDRKNMEDEATKEGNKAKRNKTPLTSGLESIGSMDVENIKQLKQVDPNSGIKQLVKISNGLELDNLNMSELQELENELYSSGSKYKDEDLDLVAQAMSEIIGRDPSGDSFGTRDADDYDLTYKGRQVRFSFYPKLRKKLMAQNRAANNGELICPHCQEEIELDQNGKEVWDSKSGKTHKTAPPIDHHNPSWKKRLAALEKKNLSVDAFAQQGRELYNAPELRILHMKCNSSIGGDH